MGEWTYKAASWKIYPKADYYLLSMRISAGAYESSIFREPDY